MTITLETIAESQCFNESNKSERAEIILWWISRTNQTSSGITIPELSGAFESLHLVKPNPTRLKQHFKSSRNVRSVGTSKYLPARQFKIKMDSEFPARPELQSDALNIDDIVLPPFVSPQRREDLKKMVSVYARLFLLENSMRGLIENILERNLGDDWWNIASNAKMKRKHSDRKENEKIYKWAPTRSDFGPLYALDWPDLITLMRKYENLFKPIIKDINFLHRFEDAGIYRNVVAHNGVLRELDDFDLIQIYYNNWIQQLS